MLRLLSLVGLLGTTLIHPSQSQTSTDNTTASPSPDTVTASVTLTASTASSSASQETPSPGAQNGKPADIKRDLIDWLLDSIDPHHETEFEGYDGWYNNPSHPELGSAGEQTRRVGDEHGVDYTASAGPFANRAQMLQQGSKL